MTAAHLYQQKCTSVAEAIRRIRRGGRIFIGSGCAEPQVLTRGLVQCASRFADNSIIQILTQGDAPFTRPEFRSSFRHNALYIGTNVLEAVETGRADYTPAFLSEVPALFASDELALDAALIQVSPPDAQGFCSLGINVDIVKAAATHARLVIAQVNRNMPRTFGDSFVHLSRIDAIIEADEPLLEFHMPEPDAVVERIGYHLARLVHDGATLQFGIGKLPNAVLSHLGDKNDLGIHTGMLSDGVMKLAQAGNITNMRKTLHPEAIVTSGCMGTRELYDFVHENPHVLFHPSDYVLDPDVICRNDDMVAINSAAMIDLTGQVSAHSSGDRLYGGIGEQVDFMRGAAQSKGGRPIIALRSTDVSGRVSHIMTHLKEESGVVTTRGDVHYVVTEYGIAYLHGKSVTERALALIEIAHPDFRNELLEEAKARSYSYADLGRFPVAPGGQDPYPAHYEHTEVFTRKQGASQEEVPIHFRPIRATDERRLQDFFYTHDDETIYRRYGIMLRSMNHKRAMSLVQLDYEARLAIVGLVGDPGQEEIIAVGRYSLDAARNMPEVAFVVHEDYRGIGVGKHLLSTLVEIAKEKGFDGVTAQVLESNAAMMNTFRNVLGRPHQQTSDGYEVALTYRFTPAPNFAPLTAAERKG